MKTIRIWDKYFVPFLFQETIQQRVKQLGEQITRDYKDKSLVVVSVLNGAFVFTADLVRAIEIPLEVSFVRYASYADTHSTGMVKELIGFDDALVRNKDVLIVEDIVDTGLTMKKLISRLEEHLPHSVRVASLLFKPTALKCDITIDYLGFEIENRFVVGYGMDYNGLGRNLQEIYMLKND